MACCEESVFQGDDWAEQIRCLRCEITGLRDEIDNASTSVGKLSSKLGSSWNVLKDMKGTVTSMVQSMYKFVQSAQMQYDLGEKIAKSYKETALNIGLSTKRTEAFSKEFKGALTEVSKFGGDLSDVQSIYSDFADSSGRVRILNDNEVSNIFKLGEATNLYGSEATELYETLDLMGISNEKATERMVGLVAESQAIGLNSSKVTKMMSSNMKSMQAYSFVGGVKGMTEMAKQAVKMRIDVSDVLQMADKFYQPEAALEAAANLQMLGGDIAQAFGDPFEVMYLSRNKPEELAKRLEEMTENMLQFNEVSGEYELPAEARMQLKSAGEQLGINTDKMVEMARQTSKMKDIKMQLSGSMFSDEEMEGIASLARMDDGEFKVDFRDENGEKVTKSIDDLTSGEAKMLLEAPENEIEYMDEMLYEAQTTNELLDNMYKSFEFGLIQDMDYYRFIEKSTKGTMVETKNLGDAVKGAAKEGMGQTWLGGKGTEATKKMEDIDEGMAEYLKKITKTIEENPIQLGGDEINIDSTGNVKLNIRPKGDTTEILPGDTSGNPPVKPDEKTTAQNSNGVINHGGTINIHVTGDEGIKNIVTPEMAQAISKKAVQQIQENGGVQTGKEAMWNFIIT